jgi:hypothetical protein
VIACEECVAQCSRRLENEPTRHARGKPEQHDAAIVPGWKSQWVPEFGIHRDEAPFLSGAVIEHETVRCSLESLTGNGRDIEARLDQYLDRGAAEVLVELELHAGFATGMST